MVSEAAVRIVAWVVEMDTAIVPPARVSGGQPHECVVRHIIAVALVDTDADPIDAGADSQPRQRKAERLARIAKLSTGDLMQQHDATLWIFAYLVNLI